MKPHLCLCIISVLLLSAAPTAAVCPTSIHYASGCMPTENMVGTWEWVCSHGNYPDGFWTPETAGVTRQVTLTQDGRMTWFADEEFDWAEDFTTECASNVYGLFHSGPVIRLLGDHSFGVGMHTPEGQAPQLLLWPEVKNAPILIFEARGPVGAVSVTGLSWSTLKARFGG